ncbi:phosphoglucomutase (alpha-D-glucose-1,6-bisphosphate-dependent) [Undibacterium sp. Ren11W]|uniref:phosphoglucomutase (alpha-D-glucose-1,6-bisphosphate-dependent) n=1 Tax=Undibacterium sp. Ren11W TaxID=3413045 RepID=UPI003BEFC025
MKNSPYAGKLATSAMLVDVPKLIADYYAGIPDLAVPAQRVMFGTSGHRGSSLERSFNEWHILAISQAVCDYRAWQGINGPLFLGLDTHALSIPASASALEVLAANGVDVMLAHNDEFTPTPAISLAILTYNRGRRSGLADGVVITPSHNPPDAGGFKYNPPNGGAADTQVTAWIEARANALITSGLNGVKRMPHEQAMRASTTHRYDYLNAYVDELDQVIDMTAIRAESIRMAVDPLGGAGVHYWGRIAERYRLDLTVLNTQVDPTFRFMSVDWDGKIRMDPSSPFAMQSLLSRFEHDHSYDIAFACDTDHDRHGIVTKSAGLLPTNHYLAVAIDYLFQHRPLWSSEMSIGKTVVSSEIINRVGSKLDRRVLEVPAGFKWFAEGLHDGILGFCGEESAGATFSRIDGTVWTSDKDGITAALLSAEITARTGMDPGEIYAKLASELGAPVGGRIDAVATPVQKKKLSNISAQQLQCGELAGEQIQHIFTNAPGNNAAIGGVKVVTANGWFAARPSGTEDIYKIYAESFRDEEHLQRILLDAQAIVDLALNA